MYYKLSNIADKQILEEEFRMPLDYASLHCPSQVINGLNEENLLVITSDRQNRISTAIWGLLPEEFTEDWVVFQNVYSTLNFDENSFANGSWHSKSFIERRCLVIVTGFFTAFMFEGVLYPYYVKRTDNRPFCIAGIYNRLDDGFITCAILTCKADDFTKKIQNTCSQMPVIPPRQLWDKWLDKDTTEEQARKILQNPQMSNLESRPIAKEFFDQNITYDSMLETVSYTNLPRGTKA